VPDLSEQTVYQQVQARLAPQVPRAPVQVPLWRVWQVLQVEVAPQEPYVDSRRWRKTVSLHLLELWQGFQVDFTSQGPHLKYTHEVKAFRMCLLQESFLA